MRGRVATVALVALLVLCVSGAVRSMEFEHRWVYVSKNLYVDDNVDAVIALMSRAKKAGYTGMVLSDSKFGRLPQMDQRYFDNVAWVVEAGRKLKFDIIPDRLPHRLLQQHPLPGREPGCGRARSSSTVRGQGRCSPAGDG